LATVQEVLQADWQEVWHSPQPPLQALFFRVAPLRTLTCFMRNPLLFHFIWHCNAGAILVSNEILSFEMCTLRVPAAFHAAPSHQNSTRFARSKTEFFNEF